MLKINKINNITGGWDSASVRDISISVGCGMGLGILLLSYVTPLDQMFPPDLAEKEKSYRDGFAQGSVPRYIYKYRESLVYRLAYIKEMGWEWEVNPDASGSESRV